MSKKMKREDLLSLEQYSEKRSAMRERVMRHKALRTIFLGEHLALYFEDIQTVQYQVQEMLRIEKIFDSVGIADELETYNPLIPDGMNLKATMMLQYTDEVERRAALITLKGIEEKVFFRVDGGEEIKCFPDEDLERSNDDKTSAVHFLRFEFNRAQINRLKNGGILSLSVNHQDCAFCIDALPDEQQKALLLDFDQGILPL
jgi:hypothetical protein